LTVVDKTQGRGTHSNKKKKQKNIKKILFLESVGKRHEIEGTKGWGVP